MGFFFGWSAVAIPIYRETPLWLSKNQPQIFADDHRSELRKVKRLRVVNSLIFLSVFIRVNLRPILICVKPESTRCQLASGRYPDTSGFRI